MIDPKTIQEIQDAPVAERIHLIEQVLQSLKQDIKPPLPASEKEFRIRKISLGQEIHIDRDQLYVERTG